MQAQCNKGITKITFQIMAAVQIFLLLNNPVKHHPHQEEIRNESYIQVIIVT